MEGTISSVENHSSIIVVWLDVDGTRQPVDMDRRSFGWMAEGEGIETVSDLEGRLVFYNGETNNFLDNVEAA